MQERNKDRPGKIKKGWVTNFSGLLLSVSLLQLPVMTSAQKITLNLKNESIKQIFQQMEKQSGYSFFYKDVDIQNLKRQGVSFSNTNLSQALESLLAPHGLNYEIVNKTVVIKKNAKALSASAATKMQTAIHGKVQDKQGKPIAGATVRLKDQAAAVVNTNNEGVFGLPPNADKKKIIVSYIGYKSVEVTMDGSNLNFTVSLEPVEEAIDDVIVTGIVSRKKESFTGATASFSGEELKMVSNQNVIQSLKALDPSFIQLENNAMGSNPNSLPNIELRGQTSVTSESLRDEFSNDPNQPLFILDGFETTLKTIVDLDINLVESITILKDAASTALYGSRASNGVIVVETKKPVAGKIRLSYTTDMMVEIPDLSGYNMMNAREKLQFEQLSGRYSNTEVGMQLILDKLYAEHLKEVNRGVDTYWLDKPLQTGFSHRHSVTAMGGDDNLKFNVGANYKNHQALMIGSGKKDWGANIDLNYRTGKLNINNRAYVSNSTGIESPYGSFAGWVKLNPYYRFMDSSDKYLENRVPTQNAGFYYTVTNPLYEASLNSFNNSNNMSLNNNTQVMYDISKGFRWQAALQLSKTSGESILFNAPLSARFDNVDVRKKGTYSNTERKGWSYTVNTMLTYAKVFAEKHNLTSNLRFEMHQTRNNLLGMMVEGFPNSSNGNPKFSYGYKEGAKPSSSTAMVRRNSIIGSVNYSYDGKYNADVSVNYDGSTAFGSNRRYSPYYAGGLSWNLHKESFMADVDWIQSLRLRSNIGITGNQNFSSISSVSIYDYNQYINKYGQGVSLTALGNPDLEWQKTVQFSSGLDLSAFGGRLNIQLNQYRKVTDPLVVAVMLPSSTGLSNYPFNAGALTVNGQEATVRVSPIYRPADRVVYTIGLTAAAIKQKYSKFDSQMEAMNTQLRESNALTRFRDSYSPSALWAVKSLGIDPATGRELFETLDGMPTFTYNSAYQQVVGDSRPTIEGVFSQSLSYKGFTANVMLRYIFGRDMLNSALYNKVENIGRDQLVNNQDKRALYDRWQKPGDHSEFKGISITAKTPMSSRFIQMENTISGESINVGYDFRDKKWLDNLHLGNLRLTAYMNDIFYISSIKRERGLEYPFARSISFSLNATLK